jgi:hypothetical protein
MRFLKDFGPIGKFATAVFANATIILVGQMQDSQRAKGVFGYNLLDVTVSPPVQHLRTHPNTLGPLSRLGSSTGSLSGCGKVALRSSIFPIQQKLAGCQEHSLVMILHGKISLVKFGQLRHRFYCVADDRTLIATMLPIYL